MNLYRVEKNDFNTWSFESNKGVKNIKKNANKRLDELPPAFNTNGQYNIIELVDNGTDTPTRKFITKIKR